MTPQVSGIPRLPAEPDIDSIRTVAPFYRKWFTDVVTWIVARHARQWDSGFLDTKYDVIRRRDFPSADPFRGTQAVFGWIQGRGLESLVCHAEWLSSDPFREAEGDELLERIERSIDRLAAAIENARDRNSGHLHFLMDPEGVPRFDGSPPPETRTYSFADTFCAKGLYAAACHRGDDRAREAALEYLAEIEQSIWDFRFRNGQFKPGQPRSADDPRLVRQEGPFMILLGALALVAERSGGSFCREAGLRIIDRILKCHVALGGDGPARAGEMWETVDESDRPRLENGRLVSDPGHSIEFVGLASRFLRAIARDPAHSGVDTDRIETAKRRLPEILFANFHNGYDGAVGGIVKSVDLIEHRPVDANLPWWSLPETMRATMEILAMAERSSSDAETLRARCRAMFALCHNALVSHYLVDTDPMLWVQTRGPDGSVVDVIPACSDVDPGYHTNMSIIEAMRLIQ